ncbi:MAG: DUF5916 domain-containing protein [Acidobacteriota bacterium]
MKQNSHSIVSKPMRMWPTNRSSGTLREAGFRKYALVLTAAVSLWPAPAEAQSARATRTDDRIRLDGRLDEPAWERAAPIGPLTQQEPREGEPPSEATEVRVLYDSDSLYIGIRCFDRSPSEIVATQLGRDSDSEVDDWVGVALDPFFDQRNGFFFVVNAAGARFDGQVSNNDEHPNLDWDGIWDAGARITEEGWAAEIAIPFKTLRFRPGQTVWGMNVERHIKRRNETDRWAGARRDVWFTNLAEAGRLEDLPVIRQGHGLDIRPYVSARREDGDFTPDAGLDIYKNLTPNLNASLTLNTDFAETEVDARQVNLTRFPLFFPEKRTFFLEGAGVFDTAGLSFWRPDLLPFFSRRIGLYGGQEVPIIAGGKITGRVGQYNIGFLDVQTDGVDELGITSQNLLVARVSRNFLRQSYVGGIFTRGNPSGAGDNNLIGADARFATSGFRGGRNLSLDVYLFRTDDGESDRADFAGGFRLDYPNDLWDLSLSWKQIGDHFRAGLGFVPRTGIRRTNVGIHYGPRPERWGIRQLSFQLRPELITNLDNRVDNWSVFAAPVNIEMDSGDRVEFNLVPEFERLGEPFEIYEGIAVPAGSYTWSRYGIEFETASKRPWVVNLNYGWGSFYNGSRRQVELGLTLKPSRHLAFEVEGERNEVHLEQGSFYTQVLSLRADSNFSPNVSWANLVQYDNESRLLGWQSRFRWILKPGNDLFLVLNRGWIRTLDREFESGSSRASVKFQYTFRF